jgi:hypothetical protein
MLARQELLSSLVGGATLNVWLSGLDGQGYNAFLLPLAVGPRPLEALTSHAVYCQAGKAFEGGVPVVFRTAAGVNTMWTALLVEQDPTCAGTLRRMKELSSTFPLACKDGDLVAAVAATNEFVQLRVAMGQRFMALVYEGTLALAAASLPVGEAASTEPAARPQPGEPHREQRRSASGMELRTSFSGAASLY